MVNVRVAFLAGLRIQEELGLNGLSIYGGGGTGEQQAGWAAALAVHIERRQGRVLNLKLGIRPETIISRR